MAEFEEHAKEQRNKHLAHFKHLLDKPDVQIKPEKPLPKMTYYKRLNNRKTTNAPVLTMFASIKQTPLETQTHTAHEEYPQPQSIIYKATELQKFLTMTAQITLWNTKSRIDAINPS